MKKSNEKIRQSTIKSFSKEKAILLVNSLHKQLNGSYEYKFSQKNFWWKLWNKDTEYIEPLVERDMNNEYESLLQTIDRHNIDDVDFSPFTDVFKNWKEYIKEEE